MTRKQPDPMLQVPPFIERPHYACRLRIDLANAMRAECKRLNCSQGVWLEVAITKALLGQLVTEKDAYEYSANERWIHKMLDQMRTDGVELETIATLRGKLASLVTGQNK